MSTTTNQALLVMDVQPNIVGRLENKDQYLEEVRATVAVAHQKEIPVIFVVVGFRPGLPEVSESNQSFGALRQNPPAGLINPRPSLEPTEKDIIVTKRRVSAFTGSDLEVVLSGLGVRHIVLAGIATSGVVLSTTREAADKDFKITILADLCADFDEEVHRVLLEKVLSKQARVVTSGEWNEIHKHL